MIPDGKGVLGLPMRLAVAIIVVSVCVPSLAYAAESFRTDTDVSDAATEVEKMVDAADTVYYSGSGSVRTVDVSLPSGCEIVVGGDGADAYTLRIIRGGNTEKTVYTERPAVKFLNGPVTVSGDSELRFECTSENGVYGVKVSYA